MEKEQQEALQKAIADVKEQMGPLVEVAEYMLEAMSNSAIPNSIARFITRIKESLVTNGFSHEEAVNIITSLDIVAMLKQEKGK